MAIKLIPHYQNIEQMLHYCRVDVDQCGKRYQFQGLFQKLVFAYVLDISFVVEANICNTFKGKNLKYGGTYGDNRVIPLVLRYNGTVYEKSMNMLTTFMPEITDSFLSKHYCLAVARANEEAKLHYTSLITNALHESTIATKQGQRDRQATGRRAPRAPPGLEGVGARIYYYIINYVKTKLKIDDAIMSSGYSMECVEYVIV
ncbi:Hypothetical_protein [Hexamita inflata]|uniref:Hypothetical_protein n=1 Tax=Hexamita inflata TaxID=28002 RepID=A0AA86TDI9_9EUKA|nr:Hypothetical protein HINF_LOCUS2206 [Hexamita inflata]